jgi:hypothetical protein
LALIEIVLPDGSPAFMTALYDDGEADNAEVALSQARRAFADLGWGDAANLVARHMVVVARREDWP